MSGHTLCGRCGYPIDGIGHQSYCDTVTPFSDGEAGPAVVVDASDQPSTKRCPQCATTKPLEDFPLDRSRRRGHGSDGRGSMCRVCDNARSRAYYARNRERVIARVVARNRRLSSTDDDQVVNG